MASLILPHRRLLQPNGPVEIDWSHPLAQGLVFYIIPNDKSARELVGGAAPNILGTTGLNVGRDGVGLYTTNTSGEGWGVAYRQDLFRTIGTEATIATQVDIRGLTSNSKLVCVPLYSNTWTQPYSTIALSRNGSNNQIGIYIGTAAGATSQNATFPVGTVTVAPDRKYVVSRSADNAWMTFNGARMTPVSRTLSVNPVAWNTGGHVALLNRSQGTTGEGTFGILYYAAIWNRALSFEEQLEFQNAPYQLLKPIPARRFYLPQTGPVAFPVAATATARLSALTGSASAATTAPARAASATGTLPKLKAAATASSTAPARAAQAAGKLKALTGSATGTTAPPSRAASMAAKLPGLRGQATAAQTAPRIAAEASGTLSALTGSATAQTTPPARSTEASGRLSALTGSSSAEVSTASIRAAAAGRFKSLSGSADASRDLPTITAEARGRIRPLAGTAPAIVYTVAVGASASARLSGLKGTASAAWEIPDRAAEITARLKPLSGRAGAWRDVPLIEASAAAKLPGLKGRAEAAAAVPEIRVNTSGRFRRLVGSASAGVGVIVFDASAAARLPKLKGRATGHMISANAAHVLETVYLTGFVDFDVDLVGTVETDIAILGAVETDIHLTGTIET